MKPRLQGITARRWLLAALVGTLISASPALADGAPELAKHSGDRSEVILVKVDPEARTADKRAVRATLGVGPQEVGIHAYGWRSYRVPKGTTAEEARRLLKDTAAAGAVEVNQELTAFAVPNDTLWSSLWGLTDIKASDAWDVQGPASDVIVAVLDTGTQLTHPDLSSVLWTNTGETPNDNIDNDNNGYVDDVDGWDFRGDDNSVYDDTDDDHGTHVAGTIAAARNNSQGIAGVTNNVTIMPIKFLGGPGGSGSTADAIDGIEYAVDNGADVINSSWGGGYSHAVCDAVAAATAAGVVHVSAAGNGGSDGIGDDVSGSTSSPASCPAAGNVTVAATNSTSNLTGFSNFSSTRVDLGAPGAGILSAVPVSGYATWNGTSMAAPHVAGAAALLLGLDPTLTPAQVEQRLMSTGTDTVALAGKTVSGRRLNLLGLVESITAPSVDPPGPAQQLAPAEGSLIGSSTAAFNWSAPEYLGDGVMQYELLVDGVLQRVVAPAVTSTTLDGITDGNHTWAVNAVGPGGGAGFGTASLSALRSFTVDTTPPVPFGILGPSATSNPRPTFSWATNDATAGVAHYAIAIDGVHKAEGGPEFTSYTLPSELTPGPHVVTVSATDHAGHVRSAGLNSTYTPPLVPSLPAKPLVEPKSRSGRVRASRGRILIPVVRSSVARTAVFTATVSVGKRRKARQRGIMRIPAGSVYAQITLSPKVLRARGKTVVRWRKRSRPFARWYGRAISPSLRAHVIRQQRRN